MLSSVKYKPDASPEKINWEPMPNATPEPEWNNDCNHYRKMMARLFHLL
jgi:hypothetical protein